MTWVSNDDWQEAHLRVHGRVGAVLILVPAQAAHEDRTLQVTLNVTRPLNLSFPLRPY